MAFHRPWPFPECTQPDMAPQHQKLSKIETLRLARNYINLLTRILSSSSSPSNVEYAYLLSRGLSQTTTNLIANSLQVHPMALMQEGNPLSPDQSQMQQLPSCEDCSSVPCVTDASWNPPSSSWYSQHDSLSISGEAGSSMTSSTPSLLAAAYCPTRQYTSTPFGSESPPQVSFVPYLEQFQNDYTTLPYVQAAAGSETQLLTTSSGVPYNSSSGFVSGGTQSSSGHFDPMNRSF
ncbi:unnamed protein product [Soboliphyme baturini]|uniref:BHLH domain-containing protein n=1 Tax=Soboliphyme baturini TaxID=241478 RepID=A0A183IJE5_9BILA|nr:unnamed protein product [Soboliphyme baturini]